MVVPVGPCVHVVMAAYKPNPKYLAAQIRSILGQSHSNLELLIVFDGPHPEIVETVCGYADSRIFVVTLPVRQGALRAFEFGLAEVLRRADGDDEMFAFCDQDDVWETDKLAVQVAALRSLCGLCHSDATIIDDEGRVVAGSLFALEQRPFIADAGTLAMFNSVTGMTMVFSRKVAEAALPFPTMLPGMQHDWWVALVAALVGQLRFLPEPLVGYRWHDANVVGAGRGSLARDPAVHDGLSTLRSTCLRQYLARFTLAEAAAELADRRGISVPRIIAELAHPGWIGACRFIGRWVVAMAHGKRNLARAAARVACGLIVALMRAGRAGVAPADLCRDIVARVGDPTRTGPQS